MKIYIFIFLLFYKVVYAGQLEELIEFAKENSPKLKEFNKLKNIYTFQENYSLSLPNPKIYLGFNNIELNKPYISSSNPMGSFSIGLTAEYIPLSKRKAEKAVFSKEKEIINVDKEIFLRQLIRQIKENYAEFIFSIRKEKILNQQIKFYQDYKKTIEENYKYGKAELKDLIALDIKVLELQKKIEEIEKDRESLKNNIFYLIGGEFKFKEDNDLKLKSFENKDIENSPYIKQINLNIEKIDKEIQKAKVQHFPDFEFITEYMYRNGLADMITFKVGIQIPVFKHKKEDLVVLQKKEEKFLKQLDLEDQRLKLKSITDSFKVAYEKNNKILSLYNQVLKEKENQIKAINLAIEYNKANIGEVLKLLDEILQTKLDILNIELENYKIMFQLEEVL